MQDKSDTLADFLIRLERLRKHLDGNMVATAKALDVSRGMLYAVKNQTVPLSDKMIRRMRDAEVSVGVVGENEPAPRLLSEPARGEYASVQINPKHATPPREPSEQELLDMFMNTLTLARRIPGGRGYVAMQMRLHLNPETLKQFEQ